MEDRVLLSVVGTRTGVVERPHAVSTTTVEVSSQNLAARRRTTVFAVSAKPTAGSAVRPEVVGTHGPAGKSLPLLRITAYRARHHYPARAYTKVANAGALSTAVTGQNGSTGSYVAKTELSGDLNGDGQVNLQDLDQFTRYYNTKRGQRNYNPAADFNANGRIGQDDARFILRNMSPLSSRIPLELDLWLSPDDQINYNGTKNSGGTTAKRFVTIHGHTTPGSIVLKDSGLGDYAFKGQAIATDAKGNFSVQVENQDGINTNNFMVIDPFNQQTIRSFPIFWTTQAYKAH